MTPVDVGALVILAVGAVILTSSVWGFPIARLRHVPRVPVVTLEPAAIDQIATRVVQIQGQQALAGGVVSDAASVEVSAAILGSSSSGTSEDQVTTTDLNRLITIPIPAAGQGTATLTGTAIGTVDDRTDEMP